MPEESEEMQQKKEEQEEQEGQSGRTPDISAKSAMSDISYLLEETPEVEFETRHDGKIIAKLTAENRSTLTNPLTQRYVSQQATQDFGKVAVEAGSMSPATPIGEGEGYKSQMRLSPAR